MFCAATSQNTTKVIRLQVSVQTPEPLSLSPRSDRHFCQRLFSNWTNKQVSTQGHNTASDGLCQNFFSSFSLADEQGWRRAHSALPCSRDASVVSSLPCRALCSLQLSYTKAASEHPLELCMVLGICGAQSKQGTECLRLFRLWWSHLWGLKSVLQHRENLLHTWTTKSWWFCTGARMQKYHARYWIKSLTPTQQIIKADIISRHLGWKPLICSYSLLYIPEAITDNSAWQHIKAQHHLNGILLLSSSIMLPCSSRCNLLKKRIQGHS